MGIAKIFATYINILMEQGTSKDAWFKPHQLLKSKTDKNSAILMSSIRTKHCIR